MVLLDTSVWIDHFRSGVPLVEGLAVSQRLLCHPFVVGELACGNLANRTRTLRMLDRLPEARRAVSSEVRAAIETQALSGRGVGFVDMHLFVSARLTPDTLLWSRDRRLLALASAAGIAFSERRLH